MSFHLGKPILVLTAIALICGTIALTRSAPQRAPLVLWTFADSHAQSYRAASVDRGVDVHLVNVNAMYLRLSALFERREVDLNQPDVVEIEVNGIARFFRPPTDEVGLLPLDKYLDESGWRSRLVESRLATWSKDGRVFGFPNDLHPVAICYRRDLFEQAGVDLASAKTWPLFAERCRAFQTYWRAHGYPLRRAIELPSSTADVLNMMLQQRHINLIDDRNAIGFADPRVAETIEFYATLIAGPDQIGGDTTPGGARWATDFANGDVCALVTADWRAGELRKYATSTHGNVAIMPLPIFDPTDAPTASWGGTMAGIPRRAKDPDASWKLITFLYTHPPTIAARFRETMILPPVKDLWAEPAFHEADTFFGNQKPGELFIDLARQMPQRYVTPYTSLAHAQLAAIQSRAARRVARGETEHLREDIRTWLDEATIDLQKRIEFGKFESQDSSGVGVSPARTSAASLTR